MRQWPLWEVFIRSRPAATHIHCGSLRAPDASEAIRIAREVYVAGAGGVSIWVVPSAALRVETA